MPKKLTPNKPEELTEDWALQTLKELFDQNYDEGDLKECRLVLKDIYGIIKKSDGAESAKKQVNPFAKKLRKAE